MRCFAYRFLNPIAIDRWQAGEILLLRQDICFKTSHRVGAGSLFAFVFFPGDRSHDGING